MATAEIGPRLRAVSKNRAEKVVYIKAEAGVSWGEFMELLDNVRPEVEIISLLTHQVERSSHGHLCLAPSCGDCARLRRLRGNWGDG